jgi:hypothetical protein
MDMTRAVALLKDRLAELDQLHRTDGEFHDWRQRTDLTLRRIFGDDHKLLTDFQKNRWAPTYSPASPEAFRSSFSGGRARAAAVLKGALYQLEELTEPANFAASASIDPELWEHVQHLVEDEQWAQIASQTAIFVESKTRQWAGLPDSKFGKDLMVAVLKPGAGLFPLGRTPGEHEGWLSLGIGIAMAVGNADRHRIQQRDDAKRYAMGVLGAGSLLLTQLRHQHANSFQG